MPKRAATSELNHFNWNQEEEHEEECTQKIASPEVMSKRTIKTGKRRILNSTSGAVKSVFTGFTGFGGTMNNSTSTDSKSAFTFLMNSNTPLLNKTNGISNQKTDNTGVEESTKNNLDTNNEYLSKLKGLNETVLEWIKIHVGKNPTCILTPIFNDYDKYLKEIQSEKHQNKDDDKKILIESPSSKNPTIATSKPLFSNNFFSSNQESSRESVNLLSQENDSSKNLISTLSPLTGSFNSKGESKSIFGSSPQLSIGISSPSGPENGPPFSGGNNVQKIENEDEPPKNTFEPVTEKEAVYSKRVKLFFKKQDDFVDNGVGTLYIKPADEDGSKYQVIVRADTNLGNILLNTMLNSSVPSKKVKNNVMIVCILQVDKELKSVPVLLRVKTEEDAESLLEQINKYKK